MGSYACTLQKGKTLNLKRFDGTTATIAQTKYLCRWDQLQSTKWSEKKGEEVSLYPRLMGAVTRIENNLGDFTADYINITNEPQKEKEIEFSWLHKPKNCISGVYNDDFPSGVEDEQYVAIKLKKGYAFVSKSNLFDFCKETPELWNKELLSYVRINEHYTATVRSLFALEDYLSGMGKDQVDRNIWFDRNIKQENLPIWQEFCLELMMVEIRQAFRKETA